MYLFQKLFIKHSTVCQALSYMQGFWGMLTLF